MMVLAHVLLALTWLAMVGPVTISNFLIGLVIGFIALVAAAPDGHRYARRVGSGIGLALYVGWALLVANLRVAVAVLGSPKKLRPQLIEVPLKDLTDVELAVLASLVTLTPGTVALDVTPSRSHLIVHLLHCDDPGAEIREIKENFEGRLLRVTRGEAVARPAPPSEARP
mgnify:CR=1 FL=1